MTDYDRTLQPGEMQVIRRGPKGDRWKRRTPIDLETGDTATIRGGNVEPPPPDPPPAGAMRGFGKAAKGGTTVTPVANRNDFLAAAKAGGNIVRVDVDIEIGGKWEVGPETTILGQGHQLARSWLFGVLRDVIVQDIELVCTDTIGSPDDADVVTLKAGWSNVYFRNVTIAGAPDVNFVAEGGENLTLDRCLIAYGLLRSAHSQSGDGDGHSLGFNLRDVGTGPKRGVSVIESGQFHTQGRFQIRGPWSEVELVQLAMYNHTEVPQVSDAVSVHFIDPICVKGPEPEKSGLKTAGGQPQPFERYVVVERLSSKPGSVYVTGHKADGFTFAAVSDKPAMLSAGPLFAGTASAGLTFSQLVAGMGCKGATVTERALTAAVARSGQYENGAQGPDPKFTW